MAARLNKAVKQSVSLLSVSKQWGLSKSRTAVTYPIAFTAVHISIGAHIGAESSVNIIIDTNTQSNTSMKFLDNYSSSVYVEWVAIGY